MFDEDLGYHFLLGLDHLKFAREMLLRVNTSAAREAFERSGWAFGEEAYTGMPELQIVEDQLNTIFAMTERRLAGDLYFIHYLNEGREEWWRGVLHADGLRVRDPEELPLHEPDFAHALIVSSPDDALVERYRRGLERAKPGLEFFVYDPEPLRHPSVRSRTRRTPPREPPKPNFLIFIDPWDDSPLETLYDIFRHLVGVWEHERGRRMLGRRYTPVSPRGAAHTFTTRTTFGRVGNQYGRRGS